MTNRHDSVKLSSPCRGGALRSRVISHLPRRSFAKPGLSYLQFRKRFTLIELLVVIAIIAVLAAMLMPALGKTKQIALKGQCVSNQKQISQALFMYGDDNNGFGPQMHNAPQNVKLDNDFQSYFFGRKQATFPIKILECPAAECNGPNIDYRAGTKKGGAYIQTDFSFAFGVGRYFESTGSSKDYGFYNYGASSGMKNRFAVTNLNYFGKLILNKYDYRYSPSDYAMLNDMEDGTKQLLSFGDHGGKNLPHGITGVNLAFFDGHVRFVEFATATRMINFGGKLRW